MLMLIVTTPRDLSSAPATLATLEMVLYVKISMNAQKIYIIAIWMVSAPTQMARFIARAKWVIPAMESTVQTRTSATWAPTAAMNMLLVPTQKDRSLAVAILVIMALDTSVLILMNVQMT